MKCKECEYYNKGMCHKKDYIKFVAPEDECRFDKKDKKDDKQ